MKFTCSKQTILQEIIIAQEIIASRNTLSILSNVLLETSSNTLSIKATDLNVSFETKIPVETDEPGSTTVYCDKFLGILRSLPEGEIEIEQADEKVVIAPVFQKIQFNLRSINSDKYPEMRVCDENLFFSIPASDLIEMVDQTIFSVSDDTTRYFLNGVYLERGGDGLIMVATDGRRLSYMNRIINQEIPHFKPVIIPPKFLHLVKKLCGKEETISLALQDNYIFAKFNAHHIASTLIDGQFPNYKRVIPEKQSYQCIVEKEVFFDALKRVSLLVEQKSKRLFLDISQEMLKLSSEENDIGKAEEEIPCEYYGEPIRLALNYAYLINPLRVMPGEKMYIGFTEANKAVSVGPFPEKDFFHVIMPMQLN
ncbi:MAG: DNA polymerase III subunit beta [Spirochaetota bacterium]